MFCEHNLFLVFLEMVLNENISFSVRIAHFRKKKSFLSETLKNNEWQQQNLLLLLSYRVKPWSRKFSVKRQKRWLSCFHLQCFSSLQTTKQHPETPPSIDLCHLFSPMDLFRIAFYFCL